MKVLVTGGAGFIGSFLTDKLVELGHKVTIYDAIEPQVHHDKLPDYINKKAKFIRKDVLDYASFKKAACDAEAIFHFAALVGVGQSQYEISKYVNININGTANLLDILANNKHKCKKLVVASSMSVYGEGTYLCSKCGRVKPFERDGKSWDPPCPNCNGKITPTTTLETDPLHATSIYAITKKTQEEMVLNFGESYSIPAVALRFNNVYGPRQSLSNPYTGVVAIFISRVKNNQPPVIYEDGLQTRDFVSVHDIAAACALALERDKANNQVMNVGTGLGVSILDIAKIIIKTFKSDVKPEITFKLRSGDIRHFVSDISKIKKLFNYKPAVTIEKGIKELISWSQKTNALDIFNSANSELQKRKLLKDLK